MIGGDNVPENIDGVWRTVGGRRIFIAKGQSLSDAMSKSGKFTKNEDISHTSSVKKQELIDKYQISESEVESIRSYTSDGHLKLNRELRQSAGDLSKCSAEVEQQCKDIDSLLSKLPKFEGVVRRGEPELMSYKYKVGEVYANPGYTSTTAWSEISGVVQLEIKQSSGCNVSKFSTCPGENEVLLPRGFRYKVTRIDKTSGGYVKVYAEEVK